MILKVAVRIKRDGGERHESKIRSKQLSFFNHFTSGHDTRCSDGSRSSAVCPFYQLPRNHLYSDDVLYCSADGFCLDFLRHGKYQESKKSGKDYGGYGFNLCADGSGSGDCLFFALSDFSAGDFSLGKYGERESRRARYDDGDDHEFLYRRRFLHASFP